MVPSAVDTAGGPGAGNQRSIRYAGRGRDDNNYTYDGIDATYIINQSQLYYVRAAIPLDTIEEIARQPHAVDGADWRHGRGPGWRSLGLLARTGSMGMPTTTCAITFSMPRTRSTP